MSLPVVPAESRTVFGMVVVLSGALWGAAAVSGKIIVAVFAIFATLLTGFVLFFFRDPERQVPEGDDNLVSPCDGQVIAIEPASVEVLGAPGKVMSIFMSVLDVHVNRNVCSGKVLQVDHRPGRRGHAGKDRAARENEQNLIVIQHSRSRIVVTQVAGFLARRIICRLKPGDAIKKGERFGMIVLGSRLMVAIPESASISVEIGQQVRAGETIIGVLSS